MKSLIPVVMAGILGIYGMIVAVIISQRGIRIIKIVKKDGSYNYQLGYSHLASGLVCGFSCVVKSNINLGCRLFNWNSWGRGHSFKRATIKNICRTDLDFNFRISIGSIWTHRLANLGFMIDHSK